MRRVRKNLINQPPVAKASVPIEEALEARGANILGENGLLHGQDRYLAKAKPGDLVIPVNELSPETRARLDAVMEAAGIKIAGQGGELSVSPFLLDGFGLAEDTDAVELLKLAKQAHSASRLRAIPFDEWTTKQTIKAYLDGHPRHQIFIYKESGLTKGALAAKMMPYPLSTETFAEVTAFYITPGHRSFRVTLQFLSILEVWAHTMNAQEITFPLIWASRASSLGKLLHRQKYLTTSTEVKKSHKGC